MKKFLLSAIAVFAFTFASAQEETQNYGFTKGDVILSGSVGFNSQKTDDRKIDRFNFSPQVGYLISNKIALGVGISFSNYKDDNGVGSINKSNTISPNLYGRYYFTPTSKLSFYSQLGFGYDSTKYTNEIQNSTQNISSTADSKGFSIGLGIGINYFLTNNLALQAKWAGLNYNSYNYTNNNSTFSRDEKSSNFGFDLNLSSIGFGFLYKI